MKWETFSFYALEVVGRDKLNNPKHEKKLLGKGVGRWTEWSKEELALLGYEDFKNQRKCVTLASLDLCTQAVFLVLEDEVYYIKEIKNLGKYRLLYLSNYKGEHFERKD